MANTYFWRDVGVVLTCSSTAFVVLRKLVFFIRRNDNGNGRCEVQDGPCHTHSFAMRAPRAPVGGTPQAPGLFGASLLTVQQPQSYGRICMPFEVQGDAPLDAVVNVRLTSEEKERLRDDADMAGMSMSELIRARYFGRKIVASANALMIKELRRIGGLLKHVHNQSDGAYSRDTAAALVSLRAYIDRLSNTVEP